MGCDHFDFREGRLHGGDAEPTRGGVPGSPRSPSRIRWAVLIARIYEVLPLLCPACGGSMRIISFVTDPIVVVAILQHLELPHTAPDLTRSRSSAGRLPPRPDPDLRSHRGRAHRRCGTQSQASYSIRRYPTSSTTEGLPPAVLPGSLSHC